MKVSFWHGQGQRVWTRLSSTCQRRLGRLPVSLWSSAPTYSRPLERVKGSKRCHYSALTNTGALLISCLRVMHCIIQSVQRTIRFSHFGSSMLPINQPRNAKSRLKAADIETLTFSWQHAPPKTHFVTKAPIFFVFFFGSHQKPFREVISPSVCGLRSKVMDDGRPMPKSAISEMPSASDVALHQSESHSPAHIKGAPLGFINSQRRASVSITAVIKMFRSCLTQTPEYFSPEA